MTWRPSVWNGEYRPPAPVTDRELLAVLTEWIAQRTGQDRDPWIEEVTLERRSESVAVASWTGGGAEITLDLVPPAVLAHLDAIEYDQSLNPERPE
jgi:hypothetical protein